MTNKDHIKQLLLKFSQNRCTPEEKVQVLEYFKDNPNVEVMPEMMSGSEYETTELSEDSEVVYAGILSKIQQEKKTIVVVKRSNRRFYFSAIAAVFIGVVALAFFIQMNNSSIQRDSGIDLLVVNDAIVLDMGDGQKEVLSEMSNVEIADNEGNILGGQQGNKLIYQKQERSNKEIIYNTLSVPYGKQFEVQLSDGSTVHMNAGSTLKYPVHFPMQGNRQVYLTGEAFFKVTKNDHQRFIVEAGDLQVAVLGTQFNVSAYAEDNAKSVVLVEGSVNMGWKEEAKENIILKPGQLGSLKPGNANVEVKEVDADIYTSWMNGELVFKDLTFENILKKMERHYNVKIINNNLSMANVKFNARFKNEEIVDILSCFKSVYGLSFEVEDDNVIIINSLDLN